MKGNAPPLFHRARLRILQSISYIVSPPLGLGEGVYVCVRMQKGWLGFRFLSQIFYL